MLLQLGTLGLSAMAVPGAAQVLAAQRGFTHGVASGEPAPQSVLLWTRYVSSDETSRLTAEISDSADFTRIIASGNADAVAARDHTAKITLGGLEPNHWYFYRFVAADGSKSCVGRTRTMPTGRVARFNIAVFSCSNMGFGWFNAYADAARDAEIDLAVHVGDYFYEYGPGTYPTADHTVPGREMLPTHEAYQLADYRLRYASYRADAALQRLHQVVPWIAMWDDHEIANDPWVGGAENHQSATEGDWEVRKAAAIQAYREWMPVSDAPYRSYEIGDLASIALPETRITGRSKQLELGPILRTPGDQTAALIAFRDGPWQAADRTLMGAAQEAWLYDHFRQSVRAGKRWQILAQQVIVGNIRQPSEAAGWVAQDAPDYVRQRAANAAAASAVGLPAGLDSWDGYPAARHRLLAAAQSAGANLVTLSGDSHNAWAFDLTDGGHAAGVEFAGQSVTSSGLESYIPAPPAVLAAALRRTNPDLKWVDTARRGYMAVTVTPERVDCVWRLWDSVRDPQTVMSTTHTMAVLHGSNRLISTE